MTTKVMVAASTKPLILSILSHSRNYGYQIIKNVELLSGGELEWAEAMLYPVLQRMERDALVQSSWEIAENGRKRKYYTITKKGKKVLEQEKEQWRLVYSTLKILWESPETLSLKLS